MSALKAFGDHVRKQAASSTSATPASDAPLAGASPVADTPSAPADTPDDALQRKSEREAQDGADSINQTIQKKGDLRQQLGKLANMDMRTLLNVLTKLYKAGTLEDVAGLTDIPVRVGVAILTVRGDFDATWRKMIVPKLPKEDQQAILERTPADVKNETGLDPTKSEKGDDDPDGVIAVGLDGAEVQAKLTWKSPLAGSLGETEFTVHVGPGGKLKQFELDVTAIKQKIEKMGALAPMLDLEATLSLNATVDNKVVSLDPNTTRVVLGALQVQAKAEIQAQFKTINFLKKVAFKVSVTGGTGGFSAGFSIEIPIPSL
jgi:hypothetical protein